MKTREYLGVVVYRHDGSWFENDLMLSEAYIINKILRENDKVVVYMANCSSETFKKKFGGTY